MNGLFRNCLNGCYHTGKSASIDSTKAETATASQNLAEATYGLSHPTLSEKQGGDLLIANGAEVIAKDEYNQTPLHLAIDSGNKEIAKLLIEHGAEQGYDKAIEALNKLKKT